MTHNQHSIAHFCIAAIIVSILTLTFWPALVQAGPTLPPRTPPTPIPKDDDDESGGPDKPVGAYIELQTQIASAGDWSVVQWQDNTGGWHDVEGWRGPLTGSANRIWWVAARDFGKGLFRWVITEGSGGRLLGASQTFNLPNQANQTLWVRVL